MNRRCMIVLVLIGWLGGSASYAQPPAAPGGPAPYGLPPSGPAPAPYAPPPGYYPAVPGYGTYSAPTPPGAYGYYPQDGTLAAPPGSPPVPGSPPLPGQPGPGPDAGKGPPPPMPPALGMMPGCCPPPPGVQMPCEPLEVPTPLRGNIPFYIGVEYLYWYIQRPSMPPLLTVGNINDFNFAGGPPPGAIGAPNTRILLEQFPQQYGHNGLRVNSGFWLDPGQVLGVQGSFFWLKEVNPKVQASGDASDPNMVIARPYVNVLSTPPNQESADPVVSPGSIAGRIRFSNPQRMLGADFNVVYNFLCSELEGVRMGLLVGGRFLSFDEKLRVEQTRQQLPDAILGIPGTIEGINENFTAYNRFYGGQLGGQTEFCLGPLLLQIVAKCAVGYNSEKLNIDGNTLLVTAADPNLGVPQSTLYSPYTLLVGPGNRGTHSRSIVSVVPEGQFNVCWNFNSNFMLRGGYNLIYWANMIRPGREIDRLVNVQNVNDFTVNQPIEPKFFYHNDNMWIQGFQVGLQVNF